MLTLALAVAALFTGLTGEASAGRIVGKDGTIYACYKASGKHKGAVRLVAKGMHCRRAERKLRWSVQGPAGATGTNGATGANGQAGATGATGQAGLEAKVTELTTRLETLEGTLNGLSNETLTKTVGAVAGITNTQLQEAVGAVADVNALCTQATALTSQVNGIASSLENTALGGIIPLGLELLVPGLPTALSPFSCP